ncbi:MAG: hypothetical protein WKF80_10295 [Thermomicrobiales bacterium]
MPTSTVFATTDREIVPGLSTHCAGCHAPLDDLHGWCGNCRVALCFPCGRTHFCTPSCPAQGCHAGLCVREVRDGVLSAGWGLPNQT